MKIEERPLEGAMMLEVSGKLTIGEGDRLLREAVDSALQGGLYNIVVNMEKTTAIDSAGVGELVSAHNRARDQGGKLVVLKLSPRVGGVLQSTRLTGIIESYDDITSALDALG
jgi:anti-sigma B factor antagonist